MRSHVVGDAKRLKGLYLALRARLENTPSSLFTVRQLKDAHRLIDHEVNHFRDSAFEGRAILVYEAMEQIEELLRSVGRGEPPAH